MYVCIRGLMDAVVFVCIVTGGVCFSISPVRTECGMFVMCCMQCCMSVSAEL